MSRALKDSERTWGKGSYLGDLTLWRIGLFQYTEKNPTGEGRRDPESRVWWITRGHSVLTVRLTGTWGETKLNQLKMFCIFFRQKYSRKGMVYRTIDGVTQISFPVGHRVSRELRELGSWEDWNQETVSNNLLAKVQLFQCLPVKQTPLSNSVPWNSINDFLS